MLVIQWLAAGTLAKAEIFDFAGYSWDQARTPDVATLLGNGVTLGGVTLSPGFPNSYSGDVGFPDRAAGQHASSTFDTSLTIGRLTGLQTTPNTSYALGLPQDNTGNTKRHGVELTWSNNRYMLDGSGDDLVVYEHGSTNQPEGWMIRAKRTDGVYSDWHYFMADSFGVYVGLTSGSGAFATSIDLADLGLGTGIGISALQIANLMPTDRVVGTKTANFYGQDFGYGTVIFGQPDSGMRPDAGAQAGGNRPNGYTDTLLDPDILYVGVMAQVVPEPGTMILLAGAALGAVVTSARARWGNGCKKKLSVAGVSPRRVV